MLPSMFFRPLLNKKFIGMNNFPTATKHCSQNWLIRLICLGIAILVFAVFGQTLGYGFIAFDDDFYVTENWHVLQGLSWENIAWSLGAGTGHYMSDTDYWMPLSLISHMADVQFFGMNPAFHHAGNVLIHAVSAVLLFLILRSLTQKLWRSAIVATIWSIHPLRVESVAWISERKEVLGGLFFMLCLASYLRYTRRPSIANASLICLCFLLGLMSKPILVTLPIVLLLLDYWPLNRFADQSRFTRAVALIREKLPLFALALFSCIMTVFTQKQTLDPSGQLPLLARVENAVISYCIYLKKMIWPTDLAIFYPFPAEGRPYYQALIAILIILVVSLCVIRLRRSHAYLVVGWFWYLVMLAPASGILRAGAQAYADRFTYLPMIGLLIAITWGVADWTAPRRKWRIIAASVTAILVLLSVAASYHQCRFWRDSKILFKHALQSTRDNFLIENNLGSVLWHEGKPAEAIDHITTALTMNPSNADAQNNMGTILWSQAHRVEAIAYFRKALELLPSYAAAHNNLGNALLQTGSPKEALLHLRLAVEILPGSSNAHFNLGNALMQNGDTRGAIVEIQTAASLNPASPDVHNTLGMLLTSNGSPKNGLQHFQRALELDPNNPAFMNNLSWVMATCPDQSLHNAPMALALAEKAVRLDRGENPSHLRTLAAAYAATDRYNEAMNTTERALQLSREQGNNDLAKSLQNDLLGLRKVLSTR